MCDYYFVCGMQRNCGSSRHFAMCCTLQKFARCSSSVFIFFSFKWHCKLLIITLLIKSLYTRSISISTHSPFLFLSTHSLSLSLHTHTHSLSVSRLHFRFFSDSCWNICFFVYNVKLKVSRGFTVTLSVLPCLIGTRKLRGFINIRLTLYL